MVLFLLGLFQCRLLLVVREVDGRAQRGDERHRELGRGEVGVVHAGARQRPRHNHGA